MAIVCSVNVHLWYVSILCPCNGILKFFEGQATSRELMRQTLVEFYLSIYRRFLSANQMASKKGRCATFSDGADGYSPSEGAVAFILTKQSLAARSRRCP